MSLGAICDCVGVLGMTAEWVIARALDRIMMGTREAQAHTILAALEKAGYVMVKKEETIDEMLWPSSTPETPQD